MDRYSRSTHDTSSWPAVFTARRAFSTIGTNQTEVQFIENHCRMLNDMEFQSDTKENDGDEDDDEDDDEDENLGSEGIFPEGDIVRTFLHVDTTPRDRLQKIMDFCEGATLVELENLAASKGNKWKGSIDAITDDGTLCSRGVLNAWEFYRELHIPRFKKTSGEIVVSTSRPPQDGITGSVDIERRILYMPNPDRWCLLALFSTVPVHEAHPLRQFVYNHIISAASLGVSFPARGFSTFTMYMHLPFFALRHEKKLRSDHRATAKGTVFKRSRSLQFSQGFQQTPNESYPLLNLYEGQISIVVTGIDDWRWSTWAFIDAFFDRSESARNFDDISQPYRVDPLLRGQLRVSHEQDPRRYFLDVCRTQAERVEEEWNAIFQVVKEMVEQQRYSTTLSPVSSTAFTLQESKERAAKLSDWLNEIEKFLAELRSCLCETMSASNQFFEADADYFQSSDVLALRSVFSRLNGLAQQLEGWSTELKEARETNISQITPQPPPPLNLHGDVSYVPTRAGFRVTRKRTPAGNLIDHFPID